jgi:hypothetical protein
MHKTHLQVVLRLLQQHPEVHKRVVLMAAAAGFMADIPKALLLQETTLLQCVVGRRARLPTHRLPYQRLLLLMIMLLL